MASGGRYSRSVEGASDIYFDFPCSPCARDGKNIEAVKCCVDCVQNFCAKCLSDHDKFDGLRGHKLLDMAGMLASGLKAPTFLPKEICTTHPGKVMDMFCGTHDVVCCGACIAIYHRPCDGIDYLPNVARGIKDSTAVIDVKDGMKTLQQQLGKVKAVRAGDLNRIGKKKVKILTDIDTYREKIIKHLDTVVKTAKDEVGTAHKKLENKINNEIQNLQDTMTTLDTNIKHIDTINVDNEVELFLQVRKGKGDQHDGNKLLQQIQTSVGKETLSFSFNTDVTDYFMNLKKIGDVDSVESNQASSTVPPCQSIVTATTFHGDYNVNVSGDTNTCDIWGTCLQDDGTLLITDYNYTLKRLDTNYKVVDHCALSGIPYGVCRTGPTEAAVALHSQQKIQFVSTSGRLSLTRSFALTVKPKYITFSNGELFISSQTPVPQVVVYSVSGDHLRRFLDDSAGQTIFTCPRQIVLNNSATKVYITDRDKGVITIDRQGNLLSTFTDPQLKSAWGVCLLENDHLLVAGDNSNNVIQVDNQGRTINVLLTEKDGIKKPQSLNYDAAHSRLIVTKLETNNIKVFNLIRK